MDWISVVPHHKGCLLASHYSCFCLQKPLQFLLVLFQLDAAEACAAFHVLHHSWRASGHPLSLALLCAWQGWAFPQLLLCPEPLIPLWCLQEKGMSSMERSLLSWVWVCHGHGVFLPLTWHLPWLCKKKREVLRHRQLCWIGEERQESWGAWLCLESTHTEVHQLQVSVIAKTK